MADIVAPHVRSKMMGRVKSSNTRPEMTVRKLLHSLGYRYRIHRADLPGRPDIAFSARRKVIEVRGCFWHQHPDPACTKASIPDSRHEWWKVKLAGNVARDQRNEIALSQLGWGVLVVWECELVDLDRTATRLVAFLGHPRA